MAKELAVKTKAVIVITGETDLVTDGETVYFIKMVFRKWQELQDAGVCLMA